MLQYLVPSKARRRLLKLLWSEDARGSVSDLSQRAGLGFSHAHGELMEMRQLGLARSVRESGKQVFAANHDHPHADLLRGLANAQPTATTTAHDDTLRRQLKTLGAPLHVEPLALAGRDVETVLAEGARLARRDPTLARALPLCFWLARDTLQWRHLLDALDNAEEKHVMGFFLDLTAELSGDARFAAWASMFRDRRLRAQREFFWQPTRRSRELAEERAPAVARKWGFVMNMGLDSFQNTFDKFSELHDCPPPIRPL